MKRFMLAVLALILAAGCGTAETAVLCYNGAEDGEPKQVTLELTENSIPAVFEALKKIPSGEDVNAPVPDGYSLTGYYIASHFAMLSLEVAGGGVFMPECLAESVLGNTPAEHVALTVNGRFTGLYPADGMIPVFYPEASGTYVVPVMRVLGGDVTAGKLLEIMAQAPEGYLCAVPGDPDGARITFEFTDEGRRMLCVDLPMSVFTALEDAQETRWQFLASVSLTLLSNIEDIDCVRVSFDGQIVNGVPDRDGTLLRIENGCISRREFAGYIGSEVAAGCFVGSADSENIRALLVSALPDTLKPSDIVAWSIKDGTAELSLSRAFYAACAGLDTEKERALIYTMVNTVCDNTVADKVRFTVEGTAVETLSGHICLEGYLVPDD